MVKHHQLSLCTQESLLHLSKTQGFTLLSDLVFVAIYIFYFTLADPCLI